MKFNTQFSEFTRFISETGKEPHALFVDERPLTISEMMRRAVNGIPLSVFKPKDDKIPLNGRFYNDDFDVLDTALKNDKRLSDEAKKALLEKQEKDKQDRRDFDSWKLEQQKKNIESSQIKPEDPV